MHENPSFAVGDWVLVARPHRTDKLQLWWIGPFQVVEVQTEFVILVRNLVRGKDYRVHVNRVCFYEHSHLLTLADIKKHAVYSTEGAEIAYIHNHRYDGGTPQMQVHWEGTDEESDSWIDFEDAYKSAPELVKEYLHVAAPDWELRSLRKRLNA